MKFEFTPEQAQIILNALIRQPYIEVVNVVNIMQSQAAEQINPVENIEASEPKK